MESLALSLSSLFEQWRKCGPAQPANDVKHDCGLPELAVHVTSPSASVGSNAKVEDWTKSLDRVPQNLPAEMTYRTFATSLEAQLYTLCNSPALPNDSDAADPKDSDAADEDRKDKILILAEESTFGGGVSGLLKDKDFGDCEQRVRIAQFPQNIAAIRAEHSRLDEKANARLVESLPGGNRLLRLDLSQFDESIDRPGAYHPALSSRSDELMLVPACSTPRGSGSNPPSSPLSQLTCAIGCSY